MDSEIRELQRRVAAAKGDPEPWFRLRVALVRAGRVEEAGIEAGDLVLVRERQSPWIKGEWKGVVRRLAKGGGLYARPVDPRSAAWTRSSFASHMPAAGVFLTPKDVVTLVEPGRSDGDLAPPKKPKRSRKKT